MLNALPTPPLSLIQIVATRNMEKWSQELALHSATALLQRWSEQDAPIAAPTLLHALVHARWPEGLRALSLGHGLPTTLLEAVDEQGRTALLAAAFEGQFESARVLVGMGACATKRTNQGWGAQHWLALGEHEQVAPFAQWLESQGASPWETDAWGLNAFFWANTSGLLAFWQARAWAATGREWSRMKSKHAESPMDVWTVLDAHNALRWAHAVTRALSTPMQTTTPSGWSMEPASNRESPIPLERIDQLRKAKQWAKGQGAST